MLGGGEQQEAEGSPAGILVVGRIGLIAVVFNFSSVVMCNIRWILVLLIPQWTVALHPVWGTTLLWPPWYWLYWECSILGGAPEAALVADLQISTEGCAGCGLEVSPNVLGRRGAVVVGALCYIAVVLQLDSGVFLRSWGTPYVITCYASGV